MNAKTISVSKRRRILVQLFYRYLLLDKSSSQIKQDLLDETQGDFDELTFKHANSIADQIPLLIKQIRTLLSREQSWKRLPFLVQAILLVGTYEINNADTPKAVTINEMTQLAKTYDLTTYYRFVNALLDKIPKP